MRKLIRKLISEEIINILKENNSDKSQKAYEDAIKKLTPLISEIVYENTDLMDQFEKWTGSTIASGNFELVDDLDNMIEESVKESTQLVNELAETILMNQCAEVLEEAVEIIKLGGEIDPSDFVVKITDVYFSDSNDAFAQKSVDKIMKWTTERINNAISNATEKKNKEEEEKKKIYSGDFPIACSSWIFLTDSSGLPLPEESAFIIKKKGSKDGICYSGSDFPLMIDGVEIYDISNKFYQEKGESPLICSYKGKDNILMPSIK